MSTSQVARPPRGRLMSINDRDKYNYKHKRRALPPPPPVKQVKRTYNCCENPIIDTSENTILCYTCGAVHENVDIVSEVTFAEGSNGAATVQGGTIHQDQRHANSMGGTMRGLGSMGSREQAALNGKNAIEALGASLNQREAVIEQAVSWYKLSMNFNFVQGRRMRNVAAISIYMAARRQPENTLMLIDLAEKIQTNVWVLGDTYKSFLKTMKEKDPAQLIGNKAVQEIEPLMLKYCRKLEFGDDSHRVADDACKVLKRMNRDWMVQGRQPAGLCGACIIIAARMNNFRRTIREVVYVVKVADSTITSRLYEYKRTQSAALTVKQFREFGPRLKVKAQPPAIWRRAEREERVEKRKRRQEEGGNAEADGENVSDNGGAEAATGTSPTRTSKRRKSNDGSSQEVSGQQPTPAATQENGIASELEAFDGNNETVIESVASALEEVEAGEATDLDFVMPKKRGRRPKMRTPIVIPPEDLEIEQDLEQEVTSTIRDWEAIFKEIATNENHDLLRRSGWTAAEMARAATDTRDAAGAPAINLDPEIGEEEFESDPDVASCILSPDEVRRKEAIWITENEEWLRTQQEKILKAELEAAEDKPKKPKQKRKHHQMGDGSVLGGQPAASAAEAAHKMLKKRAKGFSNHINYDKLKQLFPGGTTAASPSAASGSPAGAAQQQLGMGREEFDLAWRYR
ncbi:SUA7 Transcription initiation factor TFIIIB Brf1 subunit Transcription initiation factor TFIIB [Pyrenophora tritici-repentis]|nr:SUA7 Transcription initiation factor TFIIIB Brf1 subunit Transcription initiation factor TFIIB [Pyrenophora tritici-repentis]KAI1527716.1 SUA7 Transcription initiation factor TFIIIB Brf1 subunit Transcription initiation factor TFIIB [Pyrenophora tritici-repentis]KAI1561739.1 SUA7 Transcription initiation factor TFIIIB Brf1 subunit Transcription initiation factor TFIIB [Pyrenophora tritici-repentis]KAI1601257.1 SUA7 Transcription initiation factor TFIIIB Brf1 subunit Transcription initiation f